MALLSSLNWRKKREKAGAIKGRRREPAKIGESLEGFSKAFFKGFLFGEKNYTCFGGPLGM